MSEREAAWWALHDALPAGWRIGDLTFDPAIGQYELAVMSPRPHGRGKPPERVVVGLSVAFVLWLAMSPVLFIAAGYLSGAGTGWLGMVLLALLGFGILMFILAIVWVAVLRVAIHVSGMTTRRAASG